MNKRNSKVDGYLKAATRWQDELNKLREILFEFPLVEELKWRVPCYTYEDTNIAILGSFKNYCAMTFVKGVLLKDAHGILHEPGENTQSARVIKFTSTREIMEIEPILKSYIREAIEVEKAGLKVKFKTIDEREIPEELRETYENNPGLKNAFESLTPGRQRAYLLHFSGAKQSKTRHSRIEKCIPRILEGKGMND